jgi:hypothetical protein
MKFYRIQSGAYVFYAKVQRDKYEDEGNEDEDEADEAEDETISISIGSKRRPMCMLILIDSPDATTATLQSVSYDERCSSNEPMPRKIGTRAMVKGAFACIQMLFPKIETLSLTDETTLECNGKKVANANMSFILHGKTWYERAFGAEPVDKENYEELRRLYYHSNLHDVPFRRIWKQSLDLTPISRKEAKEMYKRSSTWREFYRSIYDAYQCVPFIHITVYSPFALFSPRMRTLVGEIWNIPLASSTGYAGTKEETGIHIVELRKNAFPEMDWKPLEPPKRRMFGGLIKIRRFQQMHLGNEME